MVSVDVKQHWRRRFSYAQPPDWDEHRIEYYSLSRLIKSPSVQTLTKAAAGMGRTQIRVSLSVAIIKSPLHKFWQQQQRPAWVKYRIEYHSLSQLINSLSAQALTTSAGGLGPAQTRSPIYKLWQQQQQAWVEYRFEYHSVATKSPLHKLWQ